jgi:hypothetical protein
VKKLEGFQGFRISEMVLGQGKRYTTDPALSSQRATSREPSFSQVRENVEPLFLGRRSKECQGYKKEQVLQKKRMEHSCKVLQ